MSDWINIGKTSFNKGAIKEMSFAKFKKSYSHLGDKAEEIFFKITGKKKPKKKTEE